MIFEYYIEKGILLELMLRASKKTPITFDNGRINIGNSFCGTSGVEYTNDNIERAIAYAYEEAKHDKLRTISYFDGREAEYYINGESVSLDKFREAVKGV